jgi:glycine betaine/choline ABC-type transport system substrate-binding protein
MAFSTRLLRNSHLGGLIDDAEMQRLNFEVDGKKGEWKKWPKNF